MKLKNDKERIAFLEDYRNTDNGWYLWKDDPDLGRRMWRREIDDGNASIIAEEKRRTNNVYDYKAGRLKTEVGWKLAEWYLITDRSLPFEDGSANMTMVRNYIKRIKEFAS